MDERLKGSPFPQVRLEVFPRADCSQCCSRLCGLYVGLSSPALEVNESKSCRSYDPPFGVQAVRAWSVHRYLFQFLLSIHRCVLPLILSQSRTCWLSERALLPLLCHLFLTGSSRPTRPRAPYRNTRSLVAGINMFSCFTCGTDSLTNKLLKKSLKNVKPKTKKALTTQQALRLPAQPHGQVRSKPSQQDARQQQSWFSSNGTWLSTMVALFPARTASVISILPSKTSRRLSRKARDACARLTFLLWYAIPESGAEWQRLVRVLLVSCDFKNPADLNVCSALSSTAAVC